MTVVTGEVIYPDTTTVSFGAFTGEGAVRRRPDYFEVAFAGRLTDRVPVRGTIDGDPVTALHRESAPDGFVVLRVRYD